MSCSRRGIGGCHLVTAEDLRRDGAKLDIPVRAGLTLFGNGRAA